MSGAFGWHKNNVLGDASQATPGYFNTPSMAQPSVTVRHIGGTRPASAHVSHPSPKPALASVAASISLPVPDGRHKERSTGEIVIIVCLDVTGSMSQWPEEIFRRLPQLYQVACDYFGTQDIDVLFIAHGDARTDRHAIQVGRMARGQALELELASFDRSCGGGGQATESHEIVATYLRDQLDVSSARLVYTFFVTDEAACATVDPPLVQRELGIDVRDKELDTATLFKTLGQRMSIYTVLCSTNSYGDNEQKAIHSFWDKTVGKEHILPLDDARRVVDIMLGVFAKTTGQLARFTKDLSTWQGGTKHGTQNIGTVMKSIALVGTMGPKSPNILPKAGTRPLLPPWNGSDDTK